MARFCVPATHLRDTQDMATVFWPIRNHENTARRQAVKTHGSTWPGTITRNHHGKTRNYSARQARTPGQGSRARALTTMRMAGDHHPNKARSPRRAIQSPRDSGAVPISSSLHRAHGMPKDAACRLQKVKASNARACPGRRPSDHREQRGAETHRPTARRHVPRART